MSVGRTELVTIAALLGVLVLVAPAVLATHRGARTWVRNALVWLAVGAALVALYGVFG